MNDLPALPKPDIRVDAFGEVIPTNGRGFVMGDFYAVHQMHAHGDACARAALEAAASPWQPIETAPMDGYMLVHEDSAIRALLRINGVWHKCGYPAIISPPPYEDVIVGADAKRLLPAGYRLELRDGCCDNPTHWMPLPPAPAPQTGAAPEVPNG